MGQNYDYNKCPKLPWMVDFFSTEDGAVGNTQLHAAYAASNKEFLSKLHVKSTLAACRSTQIIGTVMPKFLCEDFKKLLVGLSAVRVRMNVYNKEKATECISKIRAINQDYSSKIGRLNPLAICLEINGPEIRTGTLKDPKLVKIHMEKDCLTTLTTDADYQDHVMKDMIYVDYNNLTHVVQPGDKILLDGGLVSLSALEVAEKVVKCVVNKAGDIISQSSVTIPGAPIELPEFSLADEEMIEFGVQQNIDAFFISNVYNKESIARVRRILILEDSNSIFIIAKISNSQAVDNFDEILQEADGICVDCNKLMTEMPKEKVFLVQKFVTAKCNLAGKPVIITITLLDTPNLLKSEICDIANCIADGADAFLLCERISSGETVKSIDKVCREAEPSVYQKQIFNDLTSNLSLVEPIYSITIAAVEASMKCNAAAIVTVTSSGRTVKLLSKFRPRCPIIAIIRHRRLARCLRFYKAVDPIIFIKPYEGVWQEDVEKRLQLGITYGKFMGYINMGDAIVTVSSSRPDLGFPNTIQMFYASKYDTGEKRQSLSF